MAEKVTSMKIDPELWKQAKLLAVKRGVTLRSIVEELLSDEVEGGEIRMEGLRVSKELLSALDERRKAGEIPFTISSKRSAVELVREGRGE